MKKFGLYPGCIMPTEQYAYELSLREITPVIDIELVDFLEHDQEYAFFEDSEQLINVANIHEANIIVSLLSEYNIPAFYKSKESGEYLQIYSGFNNIIGIILASNVEIHPG